MSPPNPQMSPNSWRTLTPLSGLALHARHQKDACGIMSHMRSMHSSKQSGVSFQVDGSGDVEGCSTFRFYVAREDLVSRSKGCCAGRRGQAAGPCAGTGCLPGRVLFEPFSERFLGGMFRLWPLACLYWMSPDSKPVWHLSSLLLYSICRGTIVF